jgi:hypothetical protein
MNVAAEDVKSPPDGLVNGHAGPVGPGGIATEAPQPSGAEALKIIAGLARMSPLDFAQAKKARAAELGLNLGDLEKAVRAARKEQNKADASAEDDGSKPTQADTLVRYACEGAEFYRNPNNEDETYALVRTNGHRECWLLKSTGFKAWLRYRYFSRTGRAPKADAFNQALDTLDATARYEGPSAPVFLRRAEHEGKIYIDLCDENWRAIEVDTDGWRIVDEPPVHFIRRRGMLPLPGPVQGAHIDELRPFLNGATERDFVLMVMWLLSALSPSGPYPLLAVVGGPGTAKTTTARVLRDLFDPNAGKVRRVPKSEDDLFVQAVASACLVYDNLSAIVEWLSDALCTIATGASYTKRQLHTDSDEIILTATRPVLITSVAEVVTRTDLASRAVIVNLAVIADNKRMTEREFNAALEKARPRILGALLDAASHGLEALPTLRLENLPRMADALKWAHASEGKWWRPGKIIDAYMGCADDAVDAVLESDPALVALRTFMAKQNFYMSDDGDQTEFRYWRGAGEALLDALTGFAPEGAFRNKQCPWPADATRLSGRLSMAGPALRQRGITIERGRTGKNRTRWISIMARDDTEFDVA